MKDTHKHKETYSKYFDGHRRLSQSEESEYMWTHDKDGDIREFFKVPPGGCERGRWGERRELFMSEKYRVK